MLRKHILYEYMFSDVMGRLWEKRKVCSIRIFLVFVYTASKRRSDKGICERVIYVTVNSYKGTLPGQETKTPQIKSAQIMIKLDLLCFSTHRQASLPQ